MKDGKEKKMQSAATQNTTASNCCDPNTTASNCCDPPVTTTPVFGERVSRYIAILGLAKYWFIHATVHLCGACAAAAAASEESALYWCL